MSPDEQRSGQIVDVLTDAFRDLIDADARAFRRKFRAMAADPFAFYRGTACLFYVDLADVEDRWADERTGRVWIQGTCTRRTSARPWTGTASSSST